MAAFESKSPSPRQPGSCRLTVIVPVYNEAPTVGSLLERVALAPYPDKQILVVDDGSNDGTGEILKQWESPPYRVVLSHPTNLGKGAAIRSALPHAIGQVSIVQDADLEYDPTDYPALIDPVLRGESTVVFGSRYLAANGCPWTLNRVGGLVFNGIVRLLYGQGLTDVVTCYKAAPTSFWRALNLRARRFEVCTELTAKVCRAGIAIREVPISYSPRSVEAGKKIRWSDALPMMLSLIRWRFIRA